MTNTAQRVTAVLDAIDAGEHATTGRQFGQGMAHAAKLIRAVLPDPAETRTWVVEVPRDSDRGERNLKHLVQWIEAKGGRTTGSRSPDGAKKIQVYESRGSTVGFMEPGDSITFDAGAFTITKGES